MERIIIKALLLSSLILSFGLLAPNLTNAQQAPGPQEQAPPAQLRKRRVPKPSPSETRPPVAPRRQYLGQERRQPSNLADLERRVRDLERRVRTLELRLNQLERRQPARVSPGGPIPPEKNLRGPLPPEHIGKRPLPGRPLPPPERMEKRPLPGRPLTPEGEKEKPAEER